MTTPTTPPFNYRGWDVHAWTADYRAWIDRISANIGEPVPNDEWDSLTSDIMHKYQAVPGAIQAVQKMRKRYNPQQQGYSDPDLGNCNVAYLLKLTWCEVCAANDASVYNGFGEILSDIGSTCIQGDSHRLLSYYVALKRANVTV